MYKFLIEAVVVGGGVVFSIPIFYTIIKRGDVQDAVFFMGMGYLYSLTVLLENNF